MALLKTIETNFGVNANYWRIMQEYNDVDRARRVVVLCPYVNQEAREADKKPLDCPVTVVIEGESYTKDMTFAEIYSYLKTTPDFESAVDA